MMRSTNSCAAFLRLALILVVTVNLCFGAIGVTDLKKVKEVDGMLKSVNLRGIKSVSATATRSLTESTTLRFDIFSDDTCTTTMDSVSGIIDECFSDGTRAFMITAAADCSTARIQVYTGMLCTNSAALESDTTVTDFSTAPCEVVGDAFFTSFKMTCTPA